MRLRRQRHGSNPQAIRAAPSARKRVALSWLASAEVESQAMEDWREDRCEEAGLATFMEGSAWAEFEGFSNNLFLSAIECMHGHG